MRVAANQRELVAYDFLARLCNVRSRTSGLGTSKIGNGWPNFFSRRGGFRGRFSALPIRQHSQLKPTTGKKMTDSKKTAKDKGRSTANKLRLNKETLKDLDADKLGQVKGGGGARRCSREETGCGPV